VAFLKEAILTGATFWLRSIAADQSISPTVIPGLKGSCFLSINVDWCSEAPFVYSLAMNSWPF